MDDKRPNSGSTVSKAVSFGDSEGVNCGTNEGRMASDSRNYREVNYSTRQNYADHRLKVDRPFPHYRSILQNSDRITESTLIALVRCYDSIIENSSYRCRESDDREHDYDLV